jgi:hypothetical protein
VSVGDVAPDETSKPSHTQIEKKQRLMLQRNLPPERITAWSWVACYFLPEKHVPPMMFEAVCQSGVLSRPHKFPHGVTDIWLPHQRFAHENSTDTFGPQALDVRIGADATFTDEQDVIGNLLLDTKRMFQRRNEGPQVAVVNSKQFRARGQHAWNIFKVVQFDECVHAKTLSVPVQVVQLHIIQALGNQQHTVRTSDTRFGDLIAINHEFFAHHGDPHDLPNVAQIVEVPLEEVFIGEHAQARGSGNFVLPSDRDGVKIWANQPSGR